jgi:hypothetical protein
VSYCNNNSDKLLEMLGLPEASVFFTETTADTMKLALGYREAIGTNSFSP